MKKQTCLICGSNDGDCHYCEFGMILVDARDTFDLLFEPNNEKNNFNVGVQTCPHCNGTGKCPDVE